MYIDFQKLTITKWNEIQCDPLKVLDICSSDIKESHIPVILDIISDRIVHAIEDGKRTPKSEVSLIDYYYFRYAGSQEAEDLKEKTEHADKMNKVLSNLGFPPEANIEV